MTVNETWPHCVRSTILCCARLSPEAVDWRKQLAHDQLS
jgi:hypothetical protein